MNIDLLIKMANEIGDFFSGATGEQAARDVASHLKRFWDPRMRAQMLKYYEQRQGAGLSAVAKSAVALLYEASRAPAGAAPPSQPASPAPGAKA
ncbi:MAG TPA: formate dehydrogenase subunit delta [Steroidobacteraceae bacterium]|nr:formate dehydrogenase subunit delta [Steroidobacteraceae bacterium]